MRFIRPPFPRLPELVEHDGIAVHVDLGKDIDATRRDVLRGVIVDALEAPDAPDDDEDPLAHWTDVEVRQDE